MAQIRNPKLFSAYFGVDQEIMEESGLIDPFLNVDVPLFIDPALLKKSGFDELSKRGYEDFRQNFSNIISLVDISRKEGDVAWRNAERLLNLGEAPGTGLGYSTSRRSGTSRPREIKLQILRTAKEIVDLGSKNPDMIAVMQLFEDGVGADTISDFTTNAIMPALAEITQKFCEDNSIPVELSEYSDEWCLPVYRDSSGRRSEILLVPKDIVMDLPIAQNWAEIEKAVGMTNRIRDRVNALLGGISKSTLSERKEAIKVAALENPEGFEEFVRAVTEAAKSYSETSDRLSYDFIKKILSGDLTQYDVSKSYSVRSLEELSSLVRDTIEYFRSHVEDRNLWEQLWEGNTPKK